MTPYEINSHWTEELLQLMFEKRNNRIRKVNGKPEPVEAEPFKINRMVPDAFMAKHGKYLKIKEIKIGSPRN